MPSAVRGISHSLMKRATFAGINPPVRRQLHWRLSIKARLATVCSSSTMPLRTQSSLSAVEPPKT